MYHISDIQAVHKQLDSLHVQNHYCIQLPMPDYYKLLAGLYWLMVHQPALLRHWYSSQSLYYFLLLVYACRHTKLKCLL